MLRTGILQKESKFESPLKTKKDYKNQDFGLIMTIKVRILGLSNTMISVSDKDNFENRRRNQFYKMGGGYGI